MFEKRALVASSGFTEVLHEGCRRQDLWGQSSGRAREV